jgi:hypothetical protein
MKKPSAPEVLHADRTLPATINPDWLPLDETMARLGKSQSTIERLVGSRALRSMLSPRPGRKPERLYSAEDVERLKEESGAATSRTVTVAKKAPGALISGDGNVMLSSLVPLLTKWLNGGQGTRASEKLWLSLEEATAYSGLAESFLERAIREGKLRAVKGGPHGAWSIQRASLEAFEG